MRNVIFTNHRQRLHITRRLHALTRFIMSLLLSSLKTNAKTPYRHLENLGLFNELKLADIS